MDSSPRRRASRGHALMLAVLAVLALGALTAPLAGAAWTAPAPITGSLTDGSANAVEVKVDRAGNAYAAWAEAGSYPNSIIKVATKPAGGAWSAPTSLVAEVTPGTPIQGTAPALTLAPDGTATVVWQDSGFVTPTGIWASTRAPGGSWSTPVNVSAGAAGPFGSGGPRAVTDSTGTTTVLWQAGINMRAATRVAGGSWGAPVDVYLGTDGDTNNLYGIGADVAADGAVTVVFRVGTTGNMGLYSKTRATPTGAWGSIETIIGRGNRVGDPQLAISKAGSSTGEATAFWYDDNVGGVKIASRDTTGAWTTPASLSLGDFQAWVQKVAYDSHGNAVAVWQSATGIQWQRRDAGTWSDAAVIPGATGGSNPRLSASADGSIVAAWIANSDGANVVHTSRYENGAWSAAAIVSDAGVTAAAPGLATGPTGDADIVWSASGDTLRTATDQRVPAQGIGWTANGLTGSMNLRSWIRYLGGNSGVELSDGAARPDVNDPNSFTFSSTDAWRQQETGETVVAGHGTVRFSYPAHFIDNRIINPKFRIAADGLTGKVVSDGQGSGDMAEALNGNPSVEPYTGVHLLDLDVDAGTKIVSADGTRTTWYDVPATITAAGAQYLSYDAGTRYGFFTITAPTSLPERSLPPVDEDEDDNDPPPAVLPGPQLPAPAPQPQPQPETPKPKPPVVKTPAVIKLTGKAGKVSTKGAVTVTISKGPGAKATKTYKIVVVRNGKTIATGTVRGKTLKLAIRKTGKGKKAKYPKLTGKYTVKGAKGVKGVTTIQLTVR